MVDPLLRFRDDATVHLFDRDFDRLRELRTPKAIPENFEGKAASTVIVFIYSLSESVGEIGRDSNRKSEDNKGDTE